MTRGQRWAIGAGILVYIIMSDALPLACLPFLPRRADITSDSTEITVGGSTAIRGHISSIVNSELVPTTTATSYSTWPPFNSLFRWRVLTDSAQTMYVDGARIARIGEATIRRGRLVGLRPGAVVAELRVLGRRGTREFLVKPVGVTLAAHPPSIHLQAGDSARIVVTGSARSGLIPAGYVPLGGTYDCASEKWGRSVGWPEERTRADGRWVFNFMAMGSGVCTIRFRLADDTVALPLTVTGTLDMQRFLHPAR